MSVRDLIENNDKKSSQKYADILSYCQQIIIEEHSEILTSQEENPDALKSIIRQYINQQKFRAEGMTTDQLTGRIYVDMAGASILQPYIYEMDDVEEINVNTWNDTTITYTGGKPVKCPQQFSSPEQALNIIKRLLQTKHVDINQRTPRAISYLADGVRISANVYPVISEKDAVQASIRIVKPGKVTARSMLQFGSITEDIYNLIRVLVKYGVSVCISGATGSGKTTLLSCFLEIVDDDKRIITIEEGSREFSLRKYDEQGNPQNNVVSKITVDTDSAAGKITQEMLLESALRENPTVLGIGEMRSVESYTVAEAARTGITTYTTTHASNALDTYIRLMELSYKKYRYEQYFLLHQMMKSFPIVFFMEQFPDGSRKVSEIIEAVGFENNRVVSNVLYRYVVDDNKENDLGENIGVIGHFECVNAISEDMQNRLLHSGAPRSVVNSLLKKEGGLNS